jgi:hypothetical protein
MEASISTDSLSQTTTVFVEQSAVAKDILMAMIQKHWLLIVVVVALYWWWSHK